MYWCSSCGATHPKDCCKHSWKYSDKPKSKGKQAFKKFYQRKVRGGK